MKTAELIGPALDWAVCLALGNKPVFNPVRFGGVSYGAFESELGYAIKNYQGNWSEGGPIIEREAIELAVYGNQWRAVMYIMQESIYQEGSTPLIAAMRCYVASKLGDEVEIPKELR